MPRRRRWGRPASLPGRRADRGAAREGSGARRQVGPASSADRRAGRGTGRGAGRRVRRDGPALGPRREECDRGPTERAEGPGSGRDRGRCERRGAEAGDDRHREGGSPAAAGLRQPGQPRLSRVPGQQRRPRHRDARGLPGGPARLGMVLREPPVPSRPEVLPGCGPGRPRGGLQPGRPAGCIRLEYLPGRGGGRPRGARGDDRRGSLRPSRDLGRCPRRRIQPGRSLAGRGPGREPDPAGGRHRPRTLSQVHRVQHHRQPGLHP